MYLNLAFAYGLRIASKGFLNMASQDNYKLKKIPQKSYKSRQLQFNILKVSWHENVTL